MIRREIWLRWFALACTLTVLTAVDFCMLVTCAPRAQAATSHACCGTSAEHGAPTPATPANGPCTVQLTLADAPMLVAPDVASAAYPATVLAATATIAAPPARIGEWAADHPEPPRPRSAAPRGERAPPTR